MTRPLEKFPGYHDCNLQKVGAAPEPHLCNWCAQNVSREALSEDLLFDEIAEPELIAINLNNHFCDGMSEVERGHVEVYSKLWNLDFMTRPMEKFPGYQDC